MAKSSKIESGTGKKGKTVVEVKEVVAPVAVSTAPVTAKPSKGKAAKKPEMKKKEEKAPEKPKKAAKAAVAISTEDIGLRAYYIGERRRAMGWSGDETSDWVEAERQLQKEAAKK